MQTNTATQEFLDGILVWLTTPNAFRSVFILILSLIIAYWLSTFLAKGMIRIAQAIAVRSDNESDESRAMKLRQTETYLSIATAVVRALAVMVVGYIAWQFLTPFSAASSAAANSFAAIGAGTFFALIAGQTIGIVLRDLTAGAVMITENWYKIGDFIRIEPYADVSGVVEHFTFRATQLRALNGEIIHIHNQHITSVHVTPHGVRTIAVDVFVRDKDRGVEVINKIISAIPKGKTMLAKSLRITDIEEWGERRWRITVVGQTAPGREWLIEKFFVEALVDVDEGKTGHDRLLVLPPMPRNADETADKRFRRAVRVAQENKEPK